MYYLKVKFKTVIWKPVLSFLYGPLRNIRKGDMLFFSSKNHTHFFFFIVLTHLFPDLELTADVQKSNSFYSTHTNATEDGGLMQSSVSVGGHTTEGQDGGEHEEEGGKGQGVVNVFLKRLA